MQNDDMQWRSQKLKLDFEWLMEALGVMFMMVIRVKYIYVERENDG